MAPSKVMQILSINESESTEPAQQVGMVEAEMCRFGSKSESSTGKLPMKCSG